MARNDRTNKVGPEPPERAASTSLAPLDESPERALGAELLARAKEEGVDLVGPEGLLTRVTESVLESALGAELTEHLGYGAHDPSGRGSGNSRNGTTRRVVQTDVGPVTLNVPRDREGSFEPMIVPKHSRRLDGFDEASVSLYAKGLTTGEIQTHLDEIYGAEVSKDTGTGSGSPENRVFTCLYRAGSRGIVSEPDGIATPLPGNASERVWSKH